MTIENLRSETGWEFAVLLIKDTECIQLSMETFSLKIVMATS